MNLYFIRPFAEWWAGLDWKFRLGLPLCFLCASTALWLFADVIWLWGWVMGALLLLVSGRSQAEKKGYHF